MQGYDSQARIGPESAQVPPTLPYGIPVARTTSPPLGPPTGPWPLPGIGINPPPRRGGRLRRRLGVLGLVAISALGAAVAGGAAPRAVIDSVNALRPGSAQARLAGIETLLAELNAALAGGDGAALAALTDPADAALRVRWGGLPGRAEAFGALELSLAAAHAADSGTGAASAAAEGRVAIGSRDATGSRGGSGVPVLRPAPPRTGYSQTFEVPVDLRYRLPTWDAAAVSTRLTLQVGLRGRTWWLVDDVAADGTLVPAAPRESAPPMEPWIRGEVDVVRHERVLVVGDPGRRADNEQLAVALDRAVARVRSAVPSRSWNGRVVAYASTDARVVASWFGSRAATEPGHAGSDPAAFAAEVRTLTGATASPDAPPVATRLAVTPLLLEHSGAGSAGGDTRADAVLRHEVTHVALALDAVSEPPTWVVEGLAEYVAYRTLRRGRLDPVAALDRRGLSTATWDALSEGAWTPRLFAAPGEFYSGSNAEVAQAYTDAWLTCLFVADEFGEQALFSLHAAGDDEAAVSSVLGISRKELVERTARYAGDLRARFG